MRKSLFWARLWGIFTFVFCLGLIANLKQYHAFIASMANPANLMPLGIFTLFLGITMIVTHQVWKGWPIIITLLGFWIAFKGLIILFFPMWINAIMTQAQNTNLYYTPMPALLFSIFLMYLGFWTKRKKS